MDLLYPHSAAIDVHKKTAVVSASWVDAHGERRQQTKSFHTMTADLEQLQAWLTEHQVTHVAMESTSVYWKPIFNVLEEHGFMVVLANAGHVKAVPGRKTDVRDSEWLLDLMQHGLIQGSFIPDAPFRALRDLTRFRTNLIEERTRAINRIQKVLEDANVKLASVVTEVLGVSGRAMLDAIIAGVDDPELLASLARGTLRRKHDDLAEALNGRVRDHHRLLLRCLLAQVDQLNATMAEVSADIERRVEPYASALVLLCSIAGVKRRAAEIILAEIGIDMTRFVSDRHLCSWAAICPGNDQSAGRQRSGRIRHGNRWLRGALLQAAWAAIRVKDSYFGAQFRRIAKRRGDKRAIIAVAHSLLTVVYHVLRNGVLYEDLGADYFDRRSPKRHTQYHVRRLTELGFTVTLEPVALE